MFWAVRFIEIFYSAALQYRIYDKKKLLQSNLVYILQTFQKVLNYFFILDQNGVAIDCIFQGIDLPRFYCIGLLAWMTHLEHLGINISIICAEAHRVTFFN